MYVKYLSVNCHIFNSDQTLAINEFRESILRQIDNLSSNGADVIVIYIPNEYEIFTMQDNYDLHDIVKAYAAQKKISQRNLLEKLFRFVSEIYHLKPPPVDLGNNIHK